MSTPELWNNLGLCCFYASQYDMALSCLDRALSLANDNSMADVWCAQCRSRCPPSLLLLPAPRWDPTLTTRGPPMQV